jgi:integral membrane protein
VDVKRLLFPAYRLLAILAGIMVILLFFVAMPARYLLGADARFSLADVPSGWEHWVGDDTVLIMFITIPHGYVYMAYVLVVLCLALDRRWGVGRTLGVMLAGTLPIVGLVVEHRLTRAEKAAQGALTPQP